MIVNRETAMRLWTSRYGKRMKAVDFAGRTMVKSAYDDRNSDYGWNLDHIFPQSKGGKTADYNLICCHILTVNHGLILYKRGCGYFFGLILIII